MIEQKYVERDVSTSFPSRRKTPPLCEFGRIAIYKVRLAEDPDFVEHITRLRAMAFVEGDVWNYGLDQLDQQAIQMVAFDDSGPVGALRICLGDELLATSGLDNLYMSAGWEFEPGAEAFFDTAIEYGRFWVVRGHPRTQEIMDALLASIGAFVTAHPRYQNVFGTMALLDHTPEARQLIASYMRRHHFSGVHRVRPRRPLEAREDTLPLFHSLPQSDAFRALFHQLKEIDPDHRLPALLHLYVRRGAHMLGDVTTDETGRKLLIPLYVGATAFRGFTEQLQRRLSTATGAMPRSASAG